MEPPLAPPTSPEPPPAPPPPPPPPPPPSPYVDAPLAPATWRVLELGLDALLFVCTLGIGWLAWWIIAWEEGKTPARAILHTRAVRADTRAPASYGRIALREAVGKGIAGAAGAAGFYFRDAGLVAPLVFAASMAYCAMSGVAAALDDRKRAIWDLLARTEVVLEPEVAPTPADDVTQTAAGSTSPS